MAKPWRAVATERVLCQDDLFCVRHWPQCIRHEIRIVEWYECLHVARSNAFFVWGCTCVIYAAQDEGDNDAPEEVRGVVATHSSSKLRKPRAKVARFHFHHKWLKTNEYGTWLEADRHNVWCQACYPRRASCTTKGLLATRKLSRHGYNRVFSADMLKTHQKQRRHLANMRLLEGNNVFKHNKDKGVLGHLKVMNLQATSALIRLFRIVYKMGKLMQPLSQYPYEAATHMQNAKCTHAPDTSSREAMCGSRMFCQTCAARLSYGQ